MLWAHKSFSTQEYIMASWRAKVYIKTWLHRVYVLLFLLVSSSSDTPAATNMF